MATQAIKAIHEAVIQRYPNVVFGGPGVVVCRKIKYTDPPQWSQHAYGNGQDYGGSPDMLESLYQFLLTNRGILPIGTLCYKGRGGCTTPHTTRLHVDGLPRMKGTPQCAGGTPISGAAPRMTGGGIREPGVGTLDKATRDRLMDEAFENTRGLFPVSISNPITSVVDFLQILTEPDTYLRALLLIGGTALVLMALAVLTAPQGLELLAQLPGGVGNLARVAAPVAGGAR